MKRIKIGLPILALVTAVVFITASAFTGDKGATEQKGVSLKSVDPVLYWFDELGNYTFRQNSKTDEIVPSGCPDQGAVVCEKGYLDNDLQDPAHPEDGLKPGAVEDGVIIKQQ